MTRPAPALSCFPGCATCRASAPNSSPPSLHKQMQQTLACLAVPPLSPIFEPFFLIFGCLTPTPVQQPKTCWEPHLLQAALGLFLIMPLQTVLGLAGCGLHLPTGPRDTNPPATLQGSGEARRFPPIQLGDPMIWSNLGLLGHICTCRPGRLRCMAGILRTMQVASNRGCLWSRTHFGMNVAWFALFIPSQPESSSHCRNLEGRPSWFVCFALQ